MKNFLLLFSILILSISCNGENLWQEFNLAPKPKLEIETGRIRQIEVTGTKIDLMKVFFSNPSLHFEIEAGDFSGYIIAMQTKEEMNRMTEILLSKAFTREEVSNYLNKTINNESIMKALKGNAGIARDTKQTILNIIDQIPEITEGDNLSKEDADKINNYIDNTKKELKNIINGIFSPIDGFINKESYSWANYVQLQLITNILGNFLSSISTSIEEISKIEGWKDLKDIDLGSSEGLKKLQEALKEAPADSIYNLSLNIVKNMVAPLASLDQIANRYGKEISLPDISRIINLVSGVEK